MALSNGHQKEIFQKIKNDGMKCLPSVHWQLRSSIIASKAFLFLCPGPNPDCARSRSLVLIRWCYSWLSVTFSSCSSCFIILILSNQKSKLRSKNQKIGFLKSIIFEKVYCGMSLFVYCYLHFWGSLQPSCPQESVRLEAYIQKKKNQKEIGKLT